MDLTLLAMLYGSLLPQRRVSVGCG